MRRALRAGVVADSTRAGTYALDGTEDLSPYAKAFIEGLHTPGMELDRVFRRVNAEVASATKGRSRSSMATGRPKTCISLQTPAISALTAHGAGPTVMMAQHEIC
jgi:uncharacterized caspase-like protein